MRELSLHILDLVQNSISAESTEIRIGIIENIEKDSMEIYIEDNGCGMEEDLLMNVKSPFTTTRTTRDVGLGIPLFEAACNRCDGSLSLESQKGKGTKIRGIFKRSHFDKPPIGRINETISSLLLYENVDFQYFHRIGEKEFIFDTKEIKGMVGEDISNPAIVNWINEYIVEHLENIGVELWY